MTTEDAVRNCQYPLTAARWRRGLPQWFALALVACQLGGSSSGPAQAGAAAPHAATTYTFLAVADARVEAANPARNDGAARSLSVDREPVQEGYLQFRVEGVPGPVRGAAVRLYVVDGTVKGPAIYLAGGAWSESEITWQNRPQLTGAALDDMGALAVGEWAEFDVRAAVGGDGLYSFALRSDSRDGFDFAAREGEHPPELVLTAADEPAGAPPSVRLASPASGTSYTSAQTVAIVAEASDDVGVSRVEFYDDGVLIGTEESEPFIFSWAISHADNGAHLWTARAYDQEGNSAISGPIELQVAIAAGEPVPTSITPAVETDPVPHRGDAADDPAIWVNPADPALSAVIGTDKLGGLGVYDLSGAQLHYDDSIQPNNVDLRYHFPLGGSRVALVVASDRASDSLVPYRVDPATRALEPVAARPISTGIGVAGLCMYHSRKSDAYYAFVSDSSGTVQQWELFDDGSGHVAGRKVRTLRLGSTTEGCVADDELGRLYIAEEDVALWRYGAEPDGGSAAAQVDVVGAGGHLTADVEGLSIYHASGGRGYLIASSQGSSSYAVYERGGANGYVKSFTVADGAIDGVSYTDGIDVANGALGERFPQGVFIAQDNANDGGNQNFKLVPWEAIAHVGEPPLVVDPSWDPWWTVGEQPGQTYYVDSRGGDDASSGRSEAAAWRTLRRAGDAGLQPGDRLLLRRGSRWGEGLRLAASGTQARPIVIGAYGDGVLPVLSGASSCVSLEGAHLVLREVHVDACAWAGISIAGSYNRVEQSLITNNVAGIHVRAGAYGAVIHSNRLRDNNRMSVLTATPANDDSGAFAILLQGDTTEVAHNTISGSDAFSYDYGRDGAAIEVYGGKNCLIHHNTAFDNDAFSELGKPGTANNLFAYNVVTSTLATSVGLVTRGDGSRRGPVLGTQLYHNTIVLTGDGSQGIVCSHGCGPAVLTMHNNIIQARRKVGYADAPFDEDYNLFSGGVVQFARGRHSVVADPAFVDPRAGDLRLRPGSPAIDRGRRLSLPGIDGVPAPVDGDGDGLAEPDLGALEYVVGQGGHRYFLPYT